ncbi:hypothetical protein ACVSNX_14285 [Legionella pneumophila]
MTDTIDTIPDYVYENNFSDLSLSQGDILKVDGEFRDRFIEFYPGIKPSDGEIKFVMVLTQSCDLVRTSKRAPKLSHINVCLVRSLKSVIRRFLIDEIKPVSIGSKKLLGRDALDQLKDKLSKLLNNTDQKTLFFLPLVQPFTEDMVAILPLSFSFRTEEHYDKLLENRVLRIKPVFQAKVGHIIGELYGRIGTPDLNDFGWDDKKIRKYVKKLLQDWELIQVPDKDFIEYIKENADDGATNITKLIQECEAIKVSKSFQPLQNELIKNIKTYLIRLFDDKEKVNLLTIADPQIRSKEIKKILDAAISDN